MYLNQHFQKIVSAMWCEMKEERAVRRLKFWERSLYRADGRDSSDLKKTKHHLVTAFIGKG